MNKAVFEGFSKEQAMITIRDGDRIYLSFVADIIIVTRESMREVYNAKDYILFYDYFSLVLKYQPEPFYECIKFFYNCFDNITFKWYEVEQTECEFNVDFRSQKVIGTDLIENVKTETTIKSLYNYHIETGIIQKEVNIFLMTYQILNDEY